jgi:hypothetical protein
MNFEGDTVPMDWISTVSEAYTLDLSDLVAAGVSLGFGDKMAGATGETLTASD